MTTSAPEPQEQANAAAHARVGTHLNAKWEIESLLGVGGMATVYAGRHRNGTRAALKVLHRELSRDDGVRERFLREGRIVNQIEHPARVAVFDDDVSDDGESFLVIELLEGDTLDAMLKRAGGELPVERTLPIFDTVLDLLAECHDARIIHRDIKPANLYVTSQGAVKVLDFGVARMRERTDQERTRQGTAIGTPSFMAPEQALGLGDLVDGRADLWSVGACIYTCITGQRLHAARTEAEAFVLAATRPAPSIARAAPELPVEVVAFVDRALAYDRVNRFPDARTMRTELQSLVVALRSGTISTGAATKETGLVVKANDVVEDAENVATPAAKAEVAERLRSIWKHLAMFMGATRQYGWNHPEPTKVLGHAHEEILTTLATNADAVRFDVSPYAFSYEGTPVWEPDRAPFDRVPFQLFGDGVRKIRIRPGVTETELRDFLAVLLRDPEAAHGDDSVTAFWDRRFEHIVYLAIDSFAEGDASERDAFESQLDEVMRAAIAAARIDRDWKHDDLESEAAHRNMTAMLAQATNAASALALDAPTRGLLSAQLALPPEKWTERYVDALALGVVDADAAGDTARIAEALREWTRDQVQLRQIASAFQLEQTLSRAIAARTGADANNVARRLAIVMFGGEPIRAILTQLVDEARHAEGRKGGPAPIDPAVVEGIARVLELLGDDGFVSLACDVLDGARVAELRPALVEYVRRSARGKEAELGQRLDGASPALAADLVEILGSLGTVDAQAALGAALKSAAPHVRVAALKAIPGPTAERLEPEVAPLLDDATPEVRREAYTTIGRLRMKSIGPTLVRRVQSEAFHQAPIEERHAAFVALRLLNASRAQALAIEILAGSKLIPSAELEKSRVIAAEVLGEMPSKESVEALQQASKKRWWNTAPVREAAERSLANIEAHRGGPTSGSAIPVSSRRPSEP